MLEKGWRMMELYIETLTGAAFELRVSPYETIQNVKARIQKLEGIPISQQHLIWHSMELDDDYCLHDYDIKDGSTLRLVLNMRGGPINTRRIPVVDEPTLREVSEYLAEANREEFLDRLYGNRPVTVIVYHNGDQLNFFKIVDREAVSPSESISGGSMYNLEEEEGEDDSPLSKEQDQENDKMREKIRQLRKQMDGLAVTKKPKSKPAAPRPPSTGRPSSKVRHRRTSATGSHRISSSFNRNTCLPPVGHVVAGAEEDVAPSTSASFDPHTSDGVAKDISPTEPSIGATGPTLVAAGSLKHQDVLGSTSLHSPISNLQENQGGSEEVLGATASASPVAGASAGSRGRLYNTNAIEKRTDALENLLRNASMLSMHPPHRCPDFSQDVLLKDSPSSSASSDGAVRKRDSSTDRPPPISSMSSSLPRQERLLRQSSVEPASGPGRPPSVTTSGGARKDPLAATAPTLDSIHESFTQTLSSSTSQNKSPGRFSSNIEKRSSGGVVLESLNPSEVCGVLHDIVRSANKSRGGFSISGGRITPDARLSSKYRRDGRLLSPKHHLPPVKKKKVTKRCFLCGKKTGLAASFSCRCGHNFCSTHRYAEAHTCTFDYKTEGRKILEQNNPVVSAPKLPKI